MIEQEFEQIFKSNFTVLSNYAFSVVKDEDTAKDIVQQVFIRYWDKRDSIKITSNINSYLRRAVINTALNHLERNQKTQLTEDISHLNIYEQEKTITPDEQEMLEAEVKKAIQELPPKCQVVFSLSRFSGMTNKEIASDLEISIKAVEKHVGSALKQLRIKLKPLYNSINMLFLILFEVGYFTFLLSYIKEL
jgi:RNA polymerase sigma-70 factor (ECF subfamily)